MIQAHKGEGGDIRTFGFLIAVEAVPGINIEGVANKLADALTWVEGIAKTEVDFLGEIEVVSEEEAEFAGEVMVDGVVKES